MKGGKNVNLHMNLLVVKSIEFDAAHYLPGYNGPCREMHGHRYKLEIGVRGPVDASSGMVFDFTKLKGTLIKMIKSHLDHKCLNEVTVFGFPYAMPTAENMVKWIVRVLQEYQHLGDFLDFVRLYETPSSYAEWRKSY